MFHAPLISALLFFEQFKIIWILNRPETKITAKNNACKTIKTFEKLQQFTKNWDIFQRNPISWESRRLERGVFISK